MKNIKCLFGFHEYEMEKEILDKTENCEISNVRLVCPRCGRETDWSGTTTFSISTGIANDDNN